jgi:hypothetical protein
MAGFVKLVKARGRMLVSYYTRYVGGKPMQAVADELTQV